MASISEHPEYQRVLKEITKKTENLPPYMHEGIMNHVMLGRETGEFLGALFANNFMRTILRADDNNRRFFYEYAQLLLVIPMGAHGSPNNVKEWQKSGGMAGVIRKAMEREADQAAVESMKQAEDEAEEEVPDDPT